MNQLQIQGIGLVEATQRCPLIGEIIGATLLIAWGLPFLLSLCSLHTRGQPSVVAAGFLDSPITSSSKAGHRWDAAVQTCTLRNGLCTGAA